MKILLKRIEETNFLDAFHLELGEGQEDYVSHPIRSLAQAYVYYNQCIPFGIYHEEKMVGYVMVIYDYDEEVYNIWHMVLDKNEQGKGYGGAALGAVIAFIRTKPFGQSNRILLTCNPNNKVAYHLYTAQGFVRTERDDEDEVELELMV